MILQSLNIPKKIENIFLPPNTPLTKQVIEENLDLQKLNPVFLSFTIGSKIKPNQTPLTPLLKAISFSTLIINNSLKLYFDPTSHLIHYFLDKPRSFEELNSPCSQPIINETRICLPFKLFYVAFTKTHSHVHILVKNFQ